MFQVPQAGGERFSAADAYLHPASRPNLEVRTGPPCWGWSWMAAGRWACACGAAGEVSRCCAPGARSCWRRAPSGPPQLLQLSGIGDPDELRAIGVTPRHELPA
jgi:choline dehydrogenase